MCPYHGEGGLSPDRGEPVLDKGRSHHCWVWSITGGWVLVGGARLKRGWDRKEEPYLRGGSIPEEDRIGLEGLDILGNQKLLERRWPLTTVELKGTGCCLQPALEIRRLMGLLPSLDLKISLFPPQVAVPWIAPATSPLTPLHTSRLPPPEGEFLFAGP